MQRLTPARQRHRRCEKETSLEYLIEEKHYPLSTFDEYFTEPEGEYSLQICGNEVLLSHSQLAAALLRLPERKQEMLYLRFFHNHEKENTFGISMTDGSVFEIECRRILEREV